MRLPFFSNGVPPEHKVSTEDIKKLPEIDAAAQCAFGGIALKVNGNDAGLNFAAPGRAVVSAYIKVDTTPASEESCIVEMGEYQLLIDELDHALLALHCARQKQNAQADILNKIPQSVLAAIQSLIKGVIAARELASLRSPFIRDRIEAHRVGMLRMIAILDRAALEVRKNLADYSDLHIECLHDQGEKLLNKMGELIHKLETASYTLTCILNASIKVTGA